MTSDVKDRFPKPEWILEIGGILCAVYLGPDSNGYGITQSIPNDGKHAVVVFHCYWEDIVPLTAGLLGTVSYSGGTIDRKDPFSFPLSDEDSAEGKVFKFRTFCTSITSIEGTKPVTDVDGSVTGLAGWPYYVFARVTTEFSSPPYNLNSTSNPDVAFNDLLDQPYCITKLKVSGEVFSPPTGSFIYADGAHAGTPLIDIGASQIRARVEISATRIRMPIVPMETVGPLIGTVNLLPFKVGNQSYPKGAVLFTGINPEPRSDSYNSGIVNDIEYTFLANTEASSGNDPLDWNFFLDPTGTWTKVITADTEEDFGGDPVFAYADLSVLFSNQVS